MTKSTGQQSKADRAAIAILRNLRAGGWKVAAHNDYNLQGVFYTFWLFTNGIYCAKGEGPSDYEALVEVQQKVATIERNM